jgi:RNA polymerase sigma factor (sigma-70 family)
MGRESIMTSGTAETEIFEQHRRQVTGVAYRITGSWTDAEDIAQDVWLRWAKVHQDVDRPRNWLLRVTVRASLDRLRRLKRRRETYLGPGSRNRSVWHQILRTPRSFATPSWLGCSWCWRACLRSSAPSSCFGRRSRGITRTSPKRWAGHPLRFGNWLDEPTSTSNRPGRGLRWMSARAAESTERFLRACLDGNVDDLLRVLSPDVVMYTDGGGEAPAPKRALVGAHEVLSFFAGLGRKNVFADSTFGISYLNTHPGIITSTHGQVMSAMTFDYDPSGRIVAIYVTSAPSKLAHVSATAAAGPGNGR